MKYILYLSFQSIESVYIQNSGSKNSPFTDFGIVLLLDTKSLYVQMSQNVIDTTLTAE